MVKRTINLFLQWDMCAWVS